MDFNDYADYMESDLSTDAAQVPPREESLQVTTEDLQPQNKNGVTVVEPVYSSCNTQVARAEIQKEFGSAEAEGRTRNEVCKLRTGLANMELPPDPPDEWELNDLLQDIASCIDKDDLDRIKLMFRGPNGLGKRTLEKCDTCAKLFDTLRERLFITRGNILYLNRILGILEKPELIQKAVRYGRKEGNVIYYYTSIEEPEPGTKLVIFHVMADIENCDLETIEMLQRKVAKIVCAPAEFVRVVAVQPGSSLLVTLMLPVMYVTLLRNLLEEREILWELMAMEVNIIVIDEQFYYLSVTLDTKVETDQQRAIMNVYEQLEEKRRELGDIEQLAIKRGDEMSVLKQRLQKTEARLETAKSIEENNKVLQLTCLTLQQMHLTSPNGKAAFDDLRLCIEEANVKGQDIGLLRRVINANTLLVSAYTRNENEAKRDAERAKWKLRKAKELELLSELHTGRRSPKEVLYIKFNKFTLDSVRSINEKVADALHYISGCLSDNEQMQLMQMYNWATENDLVKDCIEADRSLLLLGLEIKESERERKGSNTGMFIERILTGIKRPDLLNEYKMKVNSQPEKPKTVLQIDADELQKCLIVGALAFQSLMQTLFSKLVPHSESTMRPGSYRNNDLQTRLVATRNLDSGFKHPHPKATQFHLLTDFFRNIGNGIHRHLRNFYVFST